MPTMVVARREIPLSFYQYLQRILSFERISFCVILLQGPIFNIPYKSQERWSVYLRLSGEMTLFRQGSSNIQPKFLQKYKICSGTNNRWMNNFGFIQDPRALWKFLALHKQGSFTSLWSSTACSSPKRVIGLQQQWLLLLQRFWCMSQRGSKSRTWLGNEHIG